MHYSAKDADPAYLIKVDLQANAFCFNPRRRQAQRNRAHARVHPMALIPHRVIRMRLKGQGPSGVRSQLPEPVQRIHQPAATIVDGQVLHGLTERTPAQKSPFIVLQLPIPTPAGLSQPVF